jgi:hypothetical protein
MSLGKRFAVRTNAGVREVVWIEVVRNGFWRGVRLSDGRPTRGPVAALVGRFETEAEARAQATPESQAG